jgi:hypothetical protein
MNKQREALKLALDALDCIYSPLHVREINKIGAAMVAIREALAEPEQEPVADSDLYAVWLNGFHSRKPLTDKQTQETELKQLRERVQELEERCDELAADKGTYFRLYEALCIKAESDKTANKKVVTDLYTEQPKRKPLTDSEVFNMAADYYEGYGFKAAEFARAIERAHGISSD